MDTIVLHSNFDLKFDSTMNLDKSVKCYALHIQF